MAFPYTLPASAQPEPSRRGWRWVRHGLFEFVDRDGKTVIGLAERVLTKWTAKARGRLVKPDCVDVDEAQRVVEDAIATGSVPR